MAEPPFRSHGARPAASPGASFLSGHTLLLSLVLVAVTVVVYAPVWQYDFVTWDDPQYVSENPHVLGGLTADAFRWAFTVGEAGLWIPVTWLSLMLDVELFGEGAGGHHATNLLLHVANTLLLFAVLRRMTGAIGRSAFVAALFAVHPLHVESVAWVTERKDVLSTFFGLLSLWAYVAYVRRSRTSVYVAAVGLFTLGLLAKPMLVTLPFVFLLLDFWPLRRVALDAAPGESWWRVIRRGRATVGRLVAEKVPFLAITLAASAVTFGAQQSVGAVSALEYVRLSSRIENALFSYVAYIAHMFWPVRLAGLYPYRDLPAAWVLGSALLLFAISVWVVLEVRRRPYLVVGWLWYLGTLLPVIGLVQVGIQARADRFTYVPMVGLFVMAAWGTSELVGRWRHAKRTLSIAAIIVIAALATTAWAQVRHWKDSLTFWQHTVDVTSENARAIGNLASVMSDQGRADEAIALFEESLGITRGFVDVHNNLANSLAAQGRTDEAIQHYLEALRLDPEYVSAHNGLGSALDDQGRYDEAIVHYEAALRVEPGSGMIHNNLGVSLTNQGQLEEAIRHFLAAVESAPTATDFRYNAAVLLVRVGRASEAVPHLEAILGTDPAHAEARELLSTVQQGGGAPPEG